MKKKSIALLMAAVLTIGVVAGSTVAWLMDTTDPVENTFTVGDINIDLTETPNTDSDNDGTDDKWEAKIIPGSTYTKDPVVEVLPDSEACYLFVKVKVENNTVNGKTIVEYTLDTTGWNVFTPSTGAVEGETIYYRTIDATAAKDGVEYHMITSDQVKINDELTKAEIEALDADNSEAIESDELPKITFTAYAVQSQNVDNEAIAWSYLP